MVAREGERRHDPLEGVSVTGCITTGVSRGRVPVDFEPILAAALDVLGAVDERVAVYLYGAVATGQAVVPESDVDLLTLDLASAVAADVGAVLSQRFLSTCRAVDVAAASTAVLEAGGDESYGLRVFLKHYCVHLAGPRRADPVGGYRPDRPRLVGSTATSPSTPSAGVLPSTGARRPATLGGVWPARHSWRSLDWSACMTGSGRPTGRLLPDGGPRSILLERPRSPSWPAGRTAREPLHAMTCSLPWMTRSTRSSTSSPAPSACGHDAQLTGCRISSSDGGRADRSSPRRSLVGGNHRRQGLLSENRTR